MPTLKQIANDLNISVSTVSRILNGKGEKSRISDATVATVLKHAEAIGYAPNLIAKGLQATQSFTLGLMIPNIANPFFAQMAKNIEKWASKAQYSILLVDSNEDVEKEKIQVKIMMGRQVDGLIIVPIGDSHEHFAQITKQKIPLVFADRYFSASKVPYITSDNYQGSYDATKELLANGHKRICLISGSGKSELVRERTRGYFDALQDANIKFSEDLVVGNAFSVKNGFDSTKKALRLKNPPTAILAMNNLIGFGVLKAIKELDLIIPETVSLIIIDDNPYLSLLNPSITTVRQNSEKIGEMAVKVVLAEIKKNFGITSMKIPTELILRESIYDLTS